MLSAQTTLRRENPTQNGAENGRTSPSTAVLLRQEAVETRLGRIVWVKNMVTRILAPLHV